MPLLRLRDLVPFRDIPEAEPPNRNYLSDAPAWQFPETAPVGIEIEVEDLNGDVREPRLVWWEKIHDGSLRGISAEYRSSGVVRPHHVPRAIVELTRMLQVVHPKHTFSPRTSIHVHVDMRDVTLPTLASLLLTYRLFEPFLYTFTAPDRRESNFCHPSYAMALPYMHKWFNDVVNLSPRPGRKDQLTLFQSFIRQVGRNKYTGFNISNLMNTLRVDDEHSGTGSIEFRHLAGTGDVPTIIQWVGALQCLYQFAREIHPKELMDIITDLNTNSEYLRLARRVFPHPILFGKFQLQPQQEIADSVSQVKELYQRPIEMPPLEELLQSPLAQSTLKSLYVSKGLETRRVPRRDRQEFNVNAGAALDALAWARANNPPVLDDVEDADDHDPADEALNADNQAF